MPSRLLGCSRNKSLPATSANGSADALAALKQVTGEALKTLSMQREYAHFLANRKSLQARRVFVESYFGGQPDQIRAAALPPTLQLLEKAWDELLPAATAVNAIALRDTSRGFQAGSTPAGSTPDAPLAEIALEKLVAVDARVQQIYFAGTVTFESE